MIEISILDHFTPEMNRYETKVINNVRTVISHWIRMIIRDAKIMAPKDTGFLMASIGGKVNFIANLHMSGMVYALAPYAAEVEAGLPGGRQYISFTEDHRGPRLREWARRHGFNVSRIKGMTVSGEARPFMMPAIMMHNAASISAFNRVLARAR